MLAKPNWLGSTEQWTFEACPFSRSFLAFLNELKCNDNLILTDDLMVLWNFVLDYTSQASLKSPQADCYTKIGEKRN